MTLVGKWRHRARIPYPRSTGLIISLPGCHLIDVITGSAEKAEIDASEDARLFSCAQRAYFPSIFTHEDWIFQTFH
jgi:hypothetical protein